MRARAFVPFQAAYALACSSVGSMHDFDADDRLLALYPVTLLEQRVCDTSIVKLRLLDDDAFDQPRLHCKVRGACWIFKCRLNNHWGLHFGRSARKVLCCCCKWPTVGGASLMA